MGQLQQIPHLSRKKTNYTRQNADYVLKYLYDTERVEIQQIIQEKTVGFALPENSLLFLQFLVDFSFSFALRLQLFAWEQCPFDNVIGINTFAFAAVTGYLIKLLLLITKYY